MQNLIGKTYNEFKVIEYSHKKGNKHYWKCLCSCGEEKVVETHNLIKGNSKCCGGRIHRIENLTNRVFGKLTVVEYSHTNNSNKSYWKCNCDCGNEITVRSDCLKDGNTKSCGCLNNEPKFTTHNKSKTKLYHVWAGAKDRCNNKNSKSYKHYGGRGIKMCDSWQDNYEVFYKWSMENGYVEGLTLERINVNEGYNPHNCCWITQSEQCNNTRRSVKLEFNGEIHNINEWAKILGINKNTLWHRINNGWDLERAFTK